MSSPTEPSPAEPSPDEVSETPLPQEVSTNTSPSDEGSKILPSTIPTVYEADAKVDPIHNLVKGKWPQVTAPPAREGLRCGPPDFDVNRPNYMYPIYGILRRTPEHRLTASEITALYKEWWNVPPPQERGLHDKISRGLRKSDLFYKLKEIESDRVQGCWTISTPKLQDLNSKRLGVGQLKRKIRDIEKHNLKPTADSTQKITAIRKLYAGFNDKQLISIFKRGLKTAENVYSEALEDCEAELDYVKKYPHVSSKPSASGSENSLEESEAVQSRTTTPDDSSQPQLLSPKQAVSTVDEPDPATTT